MKDNIYYVYILLDPLKPGSYRYGDLIFEFEPFYVGKGKSTRLYVHTCPKQCSDTKSIKKAKIRKIKESGLKVIRVKQYYDLSEKDAFEYEIDLINIIGRRDLGKGPLCNLTSGGEGSSGHKQTGEHKAKISLALKKHIKSLEHNMKVSKALTGIKRSKETKKKVSEGVKKYYADNDSPLRIKIKNVTTGELFNSTKDAAKSVGSGNGSHIVSVCKGKRKTHKGYIWGYVN